MYGGAFFAYIGDRVPQVYNNSMRALEPSRFFVLTAAKFAQLMTDWFPMAVHLLEGLLFGTRNAQEVIGQRERLLALGSLSAGLTHELNNPAAAAARADRRAARAAGRRCGTGWPPSRPARTTARCWPSCYGCRATPREQVGRRAGPEPAGDQRPRG